MASGTERSAFVTGLSGVTLTADEVAFLNASRPCGIILFSRNYTENEQLRDLISAAKDAAGGAEFLVLVDQEGGRVQRLRGSHWPEIPDAASFGALYETDAAAACRSAKLVSEWLSGLLRDVGINTNCGPCVDVPVAGADAIIGNRAYSLRRDVVAELGGCVAAGALAGGVLPVLKHIPGHGRAGVDSHMALPVIDTPVAELRLTDFAPFQSLSNMPAAMTAHVTYTDLDDMVPASISAKVTRDIIRGSIGFDGLLMSDDVSMQALSGSVGDRARAVIEAGSDIVLHCNGDLSEMREVAAAVPVLSSAPRRRYDRCLEVVRRVPTEVDELAVEQAIALVRQASAGVEKSAPKEQQG
jgi:beta-N-acetylhexosaminidase